MPPDGSNSDGLCRLLIDQFLLHEVQHHALAPDAPREAAPLQPLAHDLIDIYKCLHQGEFGVGHTIDSHERFRMRLHQELLRAIAEDVPSEPAVEVISADGEMLRINLRPLNRFYNDATVSAADDLAWVCIVSARITSGDPARFLETLDRFRQLNQAGRIAPGGCAFAFPQEAVDPFFTDLQRVIQRIRDIPVFSHSEAYRRLNHPAYRVVRREVVADSPLAAMLTE
jgi:hypothetical protein